MQRVTRYLLVTCALSILSISVVQGQFSFKPKRTNLVINFNDSTGWLLTNSSQTKTYHSNQEENLYLTLFNGELRVYSMSVNLWNTHPDYNLLDLINHPYLTIPIHHDTTWFDNFNSFWISSSGGHIRIFKFPESQTINKKNGQQAIYHNQRITNRLYLNKQKKTLITSNTTFFMITPKGSIFEVNPEHETWRLILKNRQLTAWSSEPLKQKMIFEVFKKEDYKQVIPIKSKNDKYYFQIIDHQGKMGVASLSKDYFQVLVEIPPSFDFISPSISTTYHLIYNDGKLGVLYFTTPFIKDKPKPYQVFYTHAKTTIAIDQNNNLTNNLLADNQFFKVINNDTTINSNTLSSSVNFGIQVKSKDLILYTEFNDDEIINNSGLYNIPQSKWFIKPNYSRLTSYPTSFLETKKEKNILSYTLFTQNGYINAVNVKNRSTSKFRMISSVVTETRMDSISPIPEYDDYTYKFLQGNKWGLLRIQNENISIILPPEYDWIEQFGQKKSLLLANQNQFGWYGINYCNDSLTETLIPATSPKLTFYTGNSNMPCANNTNDTNSIGSIELFNNYYVYNYNNCAWIQKELGGLHTLEGDKIEVFNHFVNIQSDQSMQLYNKNIKHLPTNTYNKISNFNNNLILYKDDQNKTNLDENSHLKFVTAFNGSKPLKAINKYQNKYYNGNFFVVKKDTEWVIFSKDGKMNSSNSFSTYLEAFKFGSSSLNNKHKK